jgi:hypothetical protein
MVQSLRQKIPSIMLRRGKAGVSPFFLIICNLLLIYIIWYLYRRKWGESNAEPGQEEKPKKEFFVKGARKPQFRGARGQQHDKASGDKGDRTHFGSRSKAQSGDRQSYRGGKSPGRDTRPRNGVFNRTQNRGTRPSLHSPRFKKPRTAAAS